MKVPKLLKDKFAEVDGAVDIVDSMDIDETSAQTVLILLLLLHHHLHHLHHLLHLHFLLHLPVV